MNKKYPINIVIAYIPWRGKILLNKRIDKAHKGLWAMVGGHLEIGETIEECVVREVKEETNLDAQFVALRGIASEIICEGGKPNEHFILWVCEVKPAHNDAMEQKEGEVKWFSRKEIEEGKDAMLQSDYIMLQNFVFKDKSRLPLHKCRVNKNGKKYEVEYFGL